MKSDFDKYKDLQFCDNPDCKRYGEVGGPNIKIMSREQGRVYCREPGCGNVWPITKDTFFYHLKKPKQKVLGVLLALSEGMGVRATSRTHSVTTDSIKNWILRAGRHMNEISLYLKVDMELSQIQIDEFWSFILKKENLTEEETQLEGLQNSEHSQKGDRWTFTAVKPQSSFIHTVHSAKRNLIEAEVFIRKIKQSSNGKAPLVESDGWFYEEALTRVYSSYEPQPYCGRGRKPNPKRIVDPELKYVQVIKVRENGKLKEVKTCIKLGDELEILAIIAKNPRCNTINTSFVESRNTTYRKDNSRLARKTQRHSKQTQMHDAHIIFLTAIINYTRENEALRECINPEAKRFQTKYKKCSPAMKEGLTNKILSVEELLMMRLPKPLP